MYKDHHFYKALESRYQAKIVEGKSVIKTFFDNPVGVAEHSEFLNDFDKWLDVIAEAEEKLLNLQKHFGDDNGPSH